MGFSISSIHILANNLTATLMLLKPQTEILATSQSLTNYDKNSESKTTYSNQGFVLNKSHLLVCEIRNRKIFSNNIRKMITISIRNMVRN